MERKTLKEKVGYSRICAKRTGGREGGCGVLGPRLSRLLLHPSRMQLRSCLRISGGVGAGGNSNLLLTRVCLITPAIPPPAHTSGEKNPNGKEKINLSYGAKKGLPGAK
eukprot:FR735736.1.p3 GENE.FR735736.1~~FR735736.1.p3  ORF type:complete len:109 (+),score=9.39 FR735736.1:1069-1395(+)